VVVELVPTGAAVVVVASMAAAEHDGGWGRWDTQFEVVATSSEAPAVNAFTPTSATPRINEVSRAYSTSVAPRLPRVSRPFASR
jgi:hypothetical protein